MYLKLTYSLLYLLTTVQNSNIDCLEGEMWFEPCRHCKCLENGKYTCEANKLSCRLGNCVKDAAVFGNNFRCHCSENNATICVPLFYQDELDGKSCSGDSYYYDSCTICRCDMKTKKLKCFPSDNCQLSAGGGGICTDGEIIFESDCYHCECTFTKFKKCVPSQSCESEEEKPGKCYAIQRYYTTNIQYICVTAMMQECYNDYDCPGQKKCCHVVDCYFRCVDPLFI